MTNKVIDMSDFDPNEAKKELDGMVDLIMRGIPFEKFATMFEAMQDNGQFFTGSYAIGDKLYYGCWNIEKALGFMNQALKSQLKDQGDKPASDPDRIYVVVIDDDFLAYVTGNPASGFYSVNPTYAMQTDLNRPIINMALPKEFDPDGHYVIIDGWHRVYKAVRLGVPGILGYTLKPDEELQCRNWFQTIEPPGTNISGMSYDEIVGKIRELSYKKVFGDSNIAVVII